MRVKTLIIALIITALLIPLGAGAASAATSVDAGQQEGLFGKVLKIGSNTLVLETSNGEVQLVVTDGTRIKVPGLESASLDDIFVEDRIAVFAEITENGYEAIEILKIPSKPARYVHIIGVVEDVSEGTATIVDRDGNTFTLELPEDAPPIEPGAVITAVNRRDLHTGRMVPRALTRLTHVVQRLEQHITELTQRIHELEGRLSDQNLAQEQLHRIERMIQENGDRKLSALESAISVADDSTKVRLAEALEQAGSDLRETALRLGVRPPYVKVAGFITNVNVDRGVITVVVSSERELDVLITDDTEIKTGHGDPASLRDLEPRIHVVVGFNYATKEAITIIVNPLDEPLDAGGEVISVDPDASKVTILVTHRGELTLNVTQDTKIQKNGAEASVRELGPGDIVKVRFIPVSLTALNITAWSPRAVVIKGVISGLAQAAGDGFPKVTVSTPGLRPHTLNVTRSTSITKDGHPSSYDNLEIGVLGSFQFDPATSNAVTINVHSSDEVQVSGVIRAFDTTSRPATMVISGSDRAVGLTLHLDASTQMEKNGHEGASLGDLAVGDLVVAFYNSTTLLASKVVAKSPLAARVVVEGILTRKEGNVWIVDETKVYLNRETHIKSTPEEGARLEVVGFRQPDGVFVALTVVVLDPHSTDLIGVTNIDGYSADRTR